MTRRRVYAEDTRIPVHQSKQDIQTLVERNGATHYAVMETPEQINIAFRMEGRNIKFTADRPDTAQKEKARWRAFLLCIKAKLESWNTGIETFEEAFLAQTVMPDGQTVAETALPRIAQAYSGNTSIPLLPGPTGGSAS